MLDHAELDQAADFIARHKALRGPELARVVGTYVLETFFGGNFEEFCRKSRSKPVSLRSLVARRGLGFSHSRLCLLVRISQQLRELSGEQGNRLSLSHHRALLPIRNASLKRELADAALIGGWSSHRLEEEVRAHLGGCRVGRKPIDGVVRSVRQLRRSLFEVQCAASSPGALSELPYGELADLREAIQVCRNALADLVTTSVRELFRMSNNGGPFVIFADTSLGKSWAFASLANGDFSVSQQQNAGVEYRFNPNGNLTIGGTLTQGSSRSVKTAIEAVDPAAVLLRVLSLPIAEWSYAHDGAVRHVGPMAEDFRELFGLGSDPTGISAIDTAGVALAAIQGLHAEAKAKEAELRQLQAENAALEQRLARLEEFLAGGGGN